MNKLIKTAAVLLMPMAMFAQVDGPHSHDRDSISYNRQELIFIIDDLVEVIDWQDNDINNGKHVCPYTQELILDVIERLYEEFEKQSKQ